MAGSSSDTRISKKIARFNRQKCINLLEKITKNLFRMFRSSTTTKTQLVDRFSLLKKKLDSLGEVHLDSNYHREMKSYIEKFARSIQGDFDLDKIRDSHMTALNRIQKIKNEVSYKRAKHINKMIDH